jgi:calcineurin-like phosphoesterase family protein
MAKFFTSDEHYGHANIIRFCNRPFSSVEDMKEGLIARHNAKVTEQDITYHLGDIFWRNVSTQEASGILSRLKGQHFLIWGNHDETAKKLSLASHCKKFVWTKDVAMVEVGKIKIWLSHYAHRVWPDSHRGSYHLFGHTHAVVPDYRLSHDAGVDANDYAPMSEEEVIAYMKAKPAFEPDAVELSIAKDPWNKTGN